jgi:hypothetical protein
VLPFLSPLLDDSRFSVAQTDIRSAVSAAAYTFAACAFGKAAPTRYVVVIAWHADTTTNPGLAPTCTIAGGAATRIEAASTGTGEGPAIGVAIFVRAVPTGTSGDVVVTWGSAQLQGIVVLRVVGYDLSAAHQTRNSMLPATGTTTIGVPSRGLLIAGSGRRNPDLSAIAFGGVRRRGSDIVQARRDWGWDHRVAVASAHSVTFTPWIAGEARQRWVLASFAPL